ncbi:hypothetical protein BFZC1_17934 [Lysinibacillus fusiformis ZC1]|nr:hypothetical protein BFZC1_17934 [Lysinibacillus fusiformis ZC1]
MSHFEAMEALGQVTIYDLLENDQPTFTVGDKVHAAITQESDYEAYMYLEAYYPNVLKSLARLLRFYLKISIGSILLEICR